MGEDIISSWKMTEPKGEFQLTINYEGRELYEQESFFTGNDVRYSIPKLPKRE